MSYKKPQIVAKSAAKQSFVAGCPEKSYWMSQDAKKCTSRNAKCNLTPLN